MKPPEIKKKFKHFFNEKIWNINPGKYGSIGRFFLRSLKIAVIIVRDFFRDRCHTLASSLTYFTLLGIVPFTAIIFVVLKHFGVQETYGADLLGQVIFDPELTSEIIAYVNRTDLSALGIIGAVVLLRIAFLLLSNIEKAFNDIWGVKERRAFYKKAIYYIAAIIILPAVITVGLSATVNLAGRVIPAAQGVLPYIITITGFSFLYFVFPTVKVRIRAALMGGVAAALLWHISQRVYILWVQRATEFNVIYGSFSQIVLVFLWIYISWIIIFIGAETSFAIQNYRIYKRDDRPEDISFALREQVAFMVASLVYKNRAGGGEPLSAEDIVNISGGPVKIINRVLYELTEMGILNEYSKKKTRFFEAAKAPDKVTAWLIDDALKKSGKTDVLLNENSPYERTEELYGEMSDYLKEKYDKESISEL